MSRIIGASVTTLSMFERDKSNISMGTFLELCSFYGVEIQDIFEGVITNNILKQIKTTYDIGKSILSYRALSG